MIALAALLGAAAGQLQQYDPYRGTEQFSGTPLFRAAGQPQRQGPGQFAGSAPHAGQGAAKGPVGGPAPPDAVQKATEEFNR